MGIAHDLAGRVEATCKWLESGTSILTTDMAHDIRARIAELEAEVAALTGRRCGQCKWWRRHTYDDDGTCTETFEYTPDWGDSDDTRTVEYVAHYASHTPADFACNRWAARAEEGGE